MSIMLASRGGEQGKQGYLVSLFPSPAGLNEVSLLIFRACSASPRAVLRGAPRTASIR